MTKGHKHWKFWAAILAAPFLWLVTFWLFQPELDLNWPIREPQKFLILILVYPIVEELLFRGYLQGWFREKNWGTTSFGFLSYANILTSLIFASLHILNHTLIMAAAIFIPSLIFGYFRDCYDGNYKALLTPIVLHCFYNAGWLWLFLKL